MKQLRRILKENLTNDCIVMTLPLGSTTSATIERSSEDALGTAEDIFDNYKSQLLDDLTLEELDTDFYLVKSADAGDETYVVGSRAPGIVKDLAYDTWGEYGDNQKILSDIPEEFWDDMFEQVGMREGSAQIIDQYTQPDPYSDDNAGGDDEGYKKIPNTDFSMNEIKQQNKEMKQRINEVRRMQVLAGIITESQLEELTFDQIALDHSNTAPNTPPGATPGTAPDQTSGKMKEGMGNFKEVPSDSPDAVVAGKSVVTDGKNYYAYKTSIGASNDNTALFVYDMKGKELKKYDLVKDKTTIEEDDILMAAVEALKSIGGRNGLGLK